MVSRGMILVGVGVVGWDGVDGVVGWAGMAMGMSGEGGGGAPRVGIGVVGVLGGVAVATGNVGGSRGKVAMSSRIDLRAVGVFAGVNRLRNCRLRRERRPYPSTRT